MDLKEEKKDDKLLNDDASGDNQDSSGDSDQKSKDMVAYETHRKLLGEKKKIQEQLEALLNEKKLREEDDLKKKNDYTKLLQNKEEELGKLKQNFESLNQRVLNGQKMNSFLKSLPGSLDEEFWGLVDLDEIVVNPDTGEIDATSVQKYAKAFSAKYSRVLTTTNSKSLPNDAPNDGNVVSYENWRSLSAKEMRAKLKDVMAKDSK